MVKDPLKRFSIAVTGDFGQQRSHEKLRQWIQVNGGTFAREINQDVTHLICSKEDYSKDVAMGMCNLSIFSFQSTLLKLIFCSKCILTRLLLLPLFLLSHTRNLSQPLHLPLLFLYQTSTYLDPMRQYIQGRESAKFLRLQSFRVTFPVFLIHN